MKVSIVATVLNNGDTVAELVESLLNQSRKADEIVIVDGGSSDNTLSVLREYERKYKVLKILHRRLNKAHARNYGIEQAKFNVIAQIDGSCVAHKHWLKRLIKPLKNPEVGVSAGFYKIVAVNRVASAVAPFIGASPRLLDLRAYMPTGRSMAIRKSVWRSLHGYSEDLQWSGEDNLFNYKLLKKGIIIERVPKAYVYWYAPKTLRDCFKKVFSYTAGIAQTGTLRHPCESLAIVNANVTATYLKWFLGSSFFFMSFYNLFFLYVTILGVTFYIFGAIYSRRDEIEDPKTLALVPLIQLLIDLSVMAGFASGLIMPLSKSKKV